VQMSPNFQGEIPVGHCKERFRRHMIGMVILGATEWFSAKIAEGQVPRWRWGMRLGPKPRKYRRRS
jgi:hypothetical protein